MSGDEVLMSKVCKVGDVLTENPPQTSTDDVETVRFISPTNRRIPKSTRTVVD